MAHARKLFPAMMKWHQWWHECRTPDNADVVCTVHPWETGRDNCPDWKIGLGNMQTDPELELMAKDIQHAKAAERPSQRNMINISLLWWS